MVVEKRQRGGRLANTDKLMCSFEYILGFLMGRRRLGECQLDVTGSRVVMSVDQVARKAARKASSYEGLLGMHMFS